MAVSDDPLARLAQQARDVLARYEKLRAETDGMTGTATSPDGAVGVTVTPTGALLELTLGPEAKAYSPDRLARMILAATRNAHSAAAEAYREKTQEFVGRTVDLAQVRRLDRDALRNLMRRID